MIAKFTANAGRVLKSARVERVRQTVLDIEAVTDMKELTALLTPE